MVNVRSVMTVAINIMLLALLIPLPQITGRNVSQPTESPAPISTFPNLEYQRRYIDPELFTSTGCIRVLVVASRALPIREVAKHMIACRATPSFGSFYVITGSMYAEKAQQLASNPLIFSILKDRKIEYSIPTDLPDISSLKASLKKNVASKLTFERDAVSGKPETTLRDVVNITGAKRTWEDLGINGTGVTIAIIDTGVDYGSMGLGYWDAVARDNMDYPAAFDPDAQCMVITNLTVSKIFTVGGSPFLNTTGANPWVYASFFGPPWVFKWSDLWGGPWPFPMNITGIHSASGNYRFGIMLQIGLAWITGYVDIFPVLVVDSVTAGVYDKVYVDLSFDWAWQGLGPWEGSFADERPVTPTGWTVAARDFTGDEIYDLSVGSLGYFLDVWGVSPNPADRGLILKPVDPAGNYVAFENDWLSHGTSCAESAAGRDKGHLLAGPGIAPGAKVMGIVGLWLGDIIEGELWAAGFDLIPGTEGWAFILGYGWVCGTWNYTGNHKADIISNSWGYSAWTLYYWYGLPWYDLLTILEDALTVPGYLHPDYPGTVIVHAGGNGAPGYGTVTGPGYGTLPISVGASTSLNYYKYSGYKGGYYDEIISWSATGPTPLGNVKPDVVNIGDGGWVPGPVWTGGGSGSSAYGLFGGTSMATPLTAGASALIIQAYRQAYGTPPTPETTKVILKSSAKDLGYDAFLQGSGRVDCFAATELALKTTGVTIASPATWNNAQQASVQHAWAFYQAFFGDPLAFKPPMGPISDTGWFAGNVKPGSSSSAEFTVKNPTASAVSAKITPMVYEQVDVKSYAAVTGPVLGTRWGHTALLSLSEIPSGTDLMTVTLTVPYAYFDVGYNYTYERNFAVFITDWNDTNANSKIDLTELYVINLGSNIGTSCEAQMSLPLSKFKHQPVIVVRQYKNFSPVPFHVYIRYFKRASWTWVTAPSTLSIGATSSQTFTATLTVPAGTPQGVYEGLIVVNVTGSYTKNVIIPVSLKVPAVLSTPDLALNLTPPATPMLYDPYRVNGYFDWGWSYESGDWKIWAFDIQDPTVVAAFVSCEWTGDMTDIDMVGINPAGFITDAALSPYLGSGIFMWQTRTGALEEYLVLDTSMIFDSVPGVYTVLLHNVLFDGTTFPEGVNGKVELVKLAPRGPINIVTRAGKTVSQGFTITTGKALNNVGLFTYYPYSPFPVSFSPSVVSSITAMGSAEITINVDVPAGTQEGTYMVILMLYAEEIPFSVSVLLNITVDNTAPTVNVVSPTSGKILGGTVPIEAYASDPSGIDKVEFKAGATSTAMTFNSATGTWKANLNTTALPDGATTINVTATDKAGNPGSTSVTFTVDNTLPSVSITAPTAGAELSGTVQVQFTVSDANLDKVLLYIDNAVVDVTGTTSYSWNTAALGDGSHTLRLVATDKAGNSREASRAVTTINVRLAVEGARNIYLAVGLPIGLIVGILIGYVLFKRKP